MRFENFDPDPPPWFWEGEGLGTVNLSNQALTNVAFIGIKKRGKFLPRATAFLVNYRQEQHTFCHLVTAEHVIAGLLTRNQEIWLRVNVLGGKTTELLIPDAGNVFRFHPNNENEPTDVAVCPFTLTHHDEETGETIKIDMTALALDGNPKNGFLPSEEFAKNSIVLGAEIAIVGLFRSHYGTNRNIPIVRVGNIAALPGEPVFTKYAGYIKAYLVEARSIAGLSGSPVVVLPDPTAMLAEGLMRPHLEQQSLALLGLMHGHFDVPNLNEDVVSDEDEPERGVHTGIGVVIPVEKIVETLEHPDLIAMRKKVIDRLREAKGATADLVADDASAEPAGDANPNHLKDFTRLVDVAARKRPQDD